MTATSSLTLHRKVLSRVGKYLGDDNALAIAITVLHHVIDLPGQLVVDPWILWLITWWPCGRLDGPFYSCEDQQM